ncbi:hypothetical protein RIF29_15019 [Crotalaria pallida]|uniref:Uncharacterized protein n=1 Tax=Crotalaria pallida TaxID=3830 RepID=A0AAN9FEW2_CROPI
MGSKALLVLFVFLATVLLISAEVVREKDERLNERDGKLNTEGVDDKKYFGGYGYGYGPWRGGYGYGYGPWRGGYGYGYGPWGGYCGPYGCKSN